MKKAAILLIIGVGVYSVCGADDIETIPKPKWQNLFDGRTLVGWIQRGGEALYQVEDGAIVGTTVKGTPNSFLCTEKIYADFILELDFKVDPALNSGVQIRSESMESYQKGRVHGYQIEIDPSERAWSGGIYDEGRRGWLNDLTKNEPAQKAFKQGQWNHFRIVALGPSIKTWLNGVSAADLTDSLTRRGFIGLQVHSTKEAEPLQVRWRNIRLLELTTGKAAYKYEVSKPGESLGVRPGAEILLGRRGDLSAWRSVRADDPALGWKFQEGVLEIVPGTGSIITKRQVRDFYLHLEFNINEMPGATGQGKGNSGVYIQRRYEIQILDSCGKEDYNSGDCGSIYRIRRCDVNACREAGQWQSYDIVFRAARWDEQGDKTENARITVLHNGKLIHDDVEIPDKTGAGQPEGPQEGPIELQEHGNVIKFRNIWLVELPDSRQEYLKQCMALGSGAASVDMLIEEQRRLDNTPGAKMRFGMVTYLWGQDWDLPTLLANCAEAGIMGVELRTTHKHGVEPALTAEQRRAVKKLFDESPVTLVGPGSDERFDDPDPEKLAQAIESTKQFIKLSYEAGGSGVKVKPDSFHAGVPREKTIEQIGKSLNVLGEYAAQYGQQVRLEVHGQCAPLPTMKAIMDIAGHPNVGVCWNCNPQDLQGEGLEYNFNLIKDRLGKTVHIRELNGGGYPYQELAHLLAAMDYDGWILLEAHGPTPGDRVKAIIEQRKIWEEMTAEAQRRVTQKQKERKVAVIELTDKVRVEIDGKLFTEYYFKKVPRPYFYPVIGPTGEALNRHWPMKEGEDEEHDHPHHRSLWFTHGDVNGHDFWAEERGSGKIVHDKFLQVGSRDDAGVIQSQNRWVAEDGEVICTDTRTHTFYYRPEGLMMDFDVTICASHGAIKLGDTKEGSMAIRLAPTMRLKGKVGQGHIINSQGDRDGDTWGKRAAWCDYYGPVKGEVVGVAIFDHPENPRHPTWWHVRDYGLFAANPFGVHDFENKPRRTGDITLAAGDSLTFRYRLYFHKGDYRQGQVARQYRIYAGTR